VSISEKQDETSTKDAVAMGVGLVLFAPALLLLAAGEDEKVEIGHLKGEYAALKRSATRKKCKFISEME
ncbi:MAG: metal ABC transporter ATP-binding protein, partial [Epsilonproteobacteria bacterium]